jgi:hypothetical protein
LKYLDATSYKIGMAHPSINTIRNNTSDIYRGMIKSRLLTGTYHLQANRAAFNKSEVNKNCLLCKTGIETREHMIAACPALQGWRNEYNSECPVNLPVDEEEYTQIILDPSRGHVIIGETVQEELELWCRRLCYRLHTERAKIMTNLPARTRYGL